MIAIGTRIDGVWRVVIGTRCGIGATLARAVADAQARAVRL